MAGFGKWVAGGLGWVFFGPIGGLLGFTLGAVIDSVDVKTEKSLSTTSGDFIMSLLVLMAAVMKADGKVLKSELDYVKAYLIRTLGEEDAIAALKVLRNILDQPVPLSDVCNQIKMHLNYSSRLQLIHLLFGLAIADKVISKDEIAVIEEISTRIGITAADIHSIKAMFIEDSNWAYDILEITKEASNEDIKKAYRKMAMKYHPDKVSYLGEEIRKSANEKFQKVNEAYEKVKKERGIV